MKRPDVVARAFQRLSDVRLVIIGDGPLRPDCEAVPGVSVYSDVDDAGVELAVGRSVGGIAFARGEHCGLTPKEFQAAGKPVIVPDEQNLCNHVVDGETGVVVEPTTLGVQAGVRRLRSTDWDREQLEAAAAEWSTASFHDRARELILDTTTEQPRPAVSRPPTVQPVTATDGGKP